MLLVHMSGERQPRVTVTRLCEYGLLASFTGRVCIATTAADACAGWRDFSSIPVLLLPAQQTLQLPAACQSVTDSDYTASAECVSTLQQPQARCEASHSKSGAAFNKCMAEAVYESLYAAYKATLSSRASLFVLPGDHGLVAGSPETVQQLLAKFAGV